MVVLLHKSSLFLNILLVLVGEKGFLLMVRLVSNMGRTGIFCDDPIADRFLSDFSRVTRDYFLVKIAFLFLLFSMVSLSSRSLSIYLYSSSLSYSMMLMSPLSLMFSQRQQQCLNPQKHWKDEESSTVYSVLITVVQYYEFIQEKQPQQHWVIERFSKAINHQTKKQGSLSGGREGGIGGQQMRWVIFLQGSDSRSLQIIKNMESSTKGFDFQSLDSSVRLDTSVFQTHLNSSLSKINSALRYLFSKLDRQEESNHRHIENTTFQQAVLNNHQEQIEAVKSCQESILEEIYGDQPGNRRVSRINLIEEEVKKIREGMRDDGVGGGLVRLQSRGKGGGEGGGGLRGSQIRVRDVNVREGSREKRGGSRMGSRAESRKRIANETENRECREERQGRESRGVGNTREQERDKCSKSMTTSFARIKGSRTHINTVQRAPDQQQQENIPDSNRRLGEDVHQLIHSRINSLQQSHQKRLEAIEKKLKMKSKGGIKFEQSRNPSESVKSVEKQGEERGGEDGASEPREGSSEKESSDQWADPSQKQYEQMKVLASQMSTQLRKQQTDQKQLTKRSNDILLKFQKNHQRVTAALKYLQRNINKIYQKLKEAHIIQEKEIIELNDDLNDKTKGDKITKLVRISERGSSEKIINRIEVMDNLVKNIEEEIREMKFSIGIPEGRGFLPRIDERQQVNRLKEGSVNRDMLQHVNGKLTELENNMDKMKVKMKSMADTADQIPLKLIQLGSKMREQSEIREQRLVQLIKQIVNRLLSDPFNNNFTNNLKKQIYVKFLEIKHEYGAIWKEIQKKVEERADRKEIEYLNEKYQTSLLEMRSMVARKTDAQDNKKWMKFVECKLRELFEAIKMSENNQYKLVQEHTLSIKKKDKEK